MPRVASEPNAILPPRTPLPTIRSRSDADGSEDSTPFAKLLDSSGSAGAPPPAPRSDRPEPANADNGAAPSGDGRVHAATAKDSKDAKDSSPADQGGDTTGSKPAQEATAAKDGTKAKLIKTAEESLDGDKSADIGSKPAPDADTTATSDTTLPNAAPTATAPTVPTPDAAAVTPAADIAAARITAPAATPEAGQLAALQGAGKADQPQGKTQVRAEATAGAGKPARIPGQPQAEAPASVGADNTSQTQAETQADAIASIGADNTPQPQGEVQANATTSVSTVKPAQTQKDAQAKVTVSVTAGKAPQTQGEAQANAASNGEPPSAPPQLEPGKDGETQRRSESVANNSQHAAGDLLPKTNIDAPSQRASDAAGAVKAGSEAMQNLGLSTPASQANAATSPASAATNLPAPGQWTAQPQALAVPMAGVGIEIATQALADKHHFEIRLDPPELGRIDVRLDVDRDGNVTSRLTADRVETLDLLRRDSVQLERALQQAGLKTSDNALEFSLRQQAFTRDDTAPQHTAQLIVPDDDPAPLEAMRQGYGRLLGLGGGLDIRV